MTAQIQTRNLTPSEVDLAYPLVRLAFPQLELDGWRDIAHPFVLPEFVEATPRGMLVADVQGVFRGLLTHETLSPSEDQDALLAANIVVPGAVGTGRLVESLSHAIRDIAGTHGVSHILVDIPNEMAGLELDWARQAREPSPIPMSVSVTESGLRPPLSATGL